MYLLNLIKMGLTLFPQGCNIILLRTLIIRKILSGIRSVSGGELFESSCSCPIPLRFFLVIVKSCSFTFFLLLLMSLSSSHQTNTLLPFSPNLILNYYYHIAKTTFCGGMPILFFYQITLVNSTISQCFRGQILNINMFLRFCLLYFMFSFLTPACLSPFYNLVLIVDDLNYVLFFFFSWVIVAIASSFPLFEDSSKNAKKKGKNFGFAHKLARVSNVRLMNKDGVRETSTCQ